MLVATAFPTLPLVSAIEAEAGGVAPAEAPLDDVPLDELANWFSMPELAALSMPASSMTCGQSGHCNFVSSCDISCPAGQSKGCSCEASGVTCKDTHNGLNPFDNDEHPVYSCVCQCNAPPPPPPPQPSEECIVEVGPVCVRETVEKATDLITGENQ